MHLSYMEAFRLPMKKHFLTARAVHLSVCLNQSHGWASLLKDYSYLHLRNAGEYISVLTSQWLPTPSFFLDRIQPQHCLRWLQCHSAVWIRWSYPDRRWLLWTENPALLCAGDTPSVWHRRRMYLDQRQGWGCRWGLELQQCGNEDAKVGTWHDPEGLPFCSSARLKCGTSSSRSHSLLTQTLQGSVTDSRRVK